MAVERGLKEPSERALRKIAENIPLPLATSLACFHPERAGLNRDEILEKVSQMQDEHLKSEKAQRAQIVAEERIAVIGSGPAGLTVAYELSQKGYGVTVFESMPEAGGMLRKCIPEFRLPKRFLEREIQSIKDLGVEFRTGVNVGSDLSFPNLWREGYKAVFVAVGAHKSQKLGIEGEELEGVTHALKFLWRANSDEKVDIGDNILVIGGGNVAVDAARTALTARTALKLGAKEVTILYRRSREEMPAIPWEVKEAEAEGVRIEFLVSPKRIIGEGGRVTGVECIRMELGEPDASGRRKALKITGSEFVRQADMVVLAIGEMPDLEFLPKEIDVNDDGTISTNLLTFETSQKGVFAAGDAVTGPATVIEAILGGKRAAVSIREYLRSLRGENA